MKKNGYSSKANGTCTPSVFQSFLGIKNHFPILILCIILQSCASKKPTSGFSQKDTPTAPNYTDLKNWAAHPDKNDPADSIPKGTDFKNTQNEAQVDVFFIHPTSLTMQRGNTHWNGDVNDAKLNKKTDGGSILYQASIFNAAGRIYAPRYRQAHIVSYFTSDKASAMKAFDVAYEDVRHAFEHYLKNWNNGRPIIIASHSQGTTHAIRLIKEFFDDKPLKNKLVVAYIVGMPVQKKAFLTITVCETPEQTGCFCGWRTFKEGGTTRFPMGDKIAVVNPITWKTSTEKSDISLHKGGVLIGFQASSQNTLSAQIHEGVLWINKPTFKGSFFFRTSNYHIGDYNLFYQNIRKDVERRVGLFWKR
jgi:Protein of unknown function (DUF3089)